MTLELTDQEAAVVASALADYRDKMMVLSNEDRANGFARFANQFAEDAQKAALVLAKLK